jgi:uncharacterized protein with GYD domain
MSTFVMLTRLAPTAVHSPDDLKTLETKAVAAVKEHCPAVEWKADYAVLGPYDYLDVFEAPDLETATKVSMLIRTVGHAHTEVWPATAWQRFNSLFRISRPPRREAGRARLGQSLRTAGRWSRSWSLAARCGCRTGRRR